MASLSYSYHLFPFLLSLGILTGTAIFAWNRRKVPGAREFAVHVFSQLLWILGFVLELTSTTLTRKLFWDDFQWLCAILAATTYFIFILRYVKGVKLTRRQIIKTIVWLIPVLLFSVSDSLHHTLRANINLRPLPPFDVLDYDYAWGVYFLSGLSLLVTSGGILILITNIFQNQREFLKQSITILLGVAIPFLGALLLMAGVVFYEQRDISPFTFALGDIIVLWGLMRYGLFDLVPVALRKVLDTIEDIVFVLDNQRRVVFMNRVGLQRTHLDMRNSLGQPVQILFSKYRELLEQFSRVYEAEEEVSLLEEGPTPTQFRMKMLPLVFSKGELAGRVVVLSDITKYKAMTEELRRLKDEAEFLVKERTAELQQRNRELMEEIELRVLAEKTIQQSLDEKNLLIREIHHRVRNNMSVILSLLNIQAEYLENKDCLKSLNGIRSRIYSMSLAHTMMYQSVDFKNILINEYARRIYSNVVQMKPPQCELNFSLQENQIAITVEKAVPLGLILNEVLSNAVRHAFVGREHGHIEMTVESNSAGEIWLLIQDNGVGFDRESLPESACFGLKIIELLSEQLTGHFQLESQKGTRVSLRFPE